MSRTRWIALSVAAVAAGLFAWIRLAHQGAASRSDGLVVGKRFPPGILDEASAATRSVAKPTTATPSSDHAAAYRDAGDLLAFLDSLAPAADRGDASAMYWMFRASLVPATWWRKSSRICATWHALHCAPRTLPHSYSSGT